MEKILSIEEIKIEIDELEFVGYSIQTDKQVIKFIIDNERCTYENYGYFSSEDYVQEFIGAHLFDIKLTDTMRNVEKMSELAEEDVDNKWIKRNTMLIDLETDNGFL